MEDIVLYIYLPMPRHEGGGELFQIYSETHR